MCLDTDDSDGGCTANDAALPVEGHVLVVEHGLVGVGVRIESCETGWGVCIVEREHGGMGEGGRVSEDGEVLAVRECDLPGLRESNAAPKQARSPAQHAAVVAAAISEAAAGVTTPATTDEVAAAGEANDIRTAAAALGRGTAGRGHVTRRCYSNDGSLNYVLQK